MNLVIALMLSQFSLADAGIILLKRRVEELYEVKQAKRSFKWLIPFAKLIEVLAREMKFSNTSEVFVNYDALEYQETRKKQGLFDLFRQNRCKVYQTLTPKESIFGTVDRYVVLETIRALKEKEERNKTLTDIVDNIQSRLAKNLKEILR